MEKEIYNWETTFDTASQTMTHVFSDRIKVVVDFSFGMIITVKDGNPIDRFECGDMSVDNYTTFLVGVEKSAESLKSWTEV